MIDELSGRRKFGRLHGDFLRRKWGFSGFFHFYLIKKIFINKFDKASVNEI